MDIQRCVDFTFLEIPDEAKLDLFSYSIKIEQLLVLEIMEELHFDGFFVE